MYKEIQQSIEKTLPPLYLERRIGCTNTSVYGGLHHFLEKNLHQIKKNLEDREMRQRVTVLEEAFSQYSYLKRRERELLVTNTIEDLQILQAKTSYSLWNLPVSSIQGVGKKRSEGLGRLGIRSIGQLFSLLPRYYEDRRKTVKISELTPSFEMAYSMKGCIKRLSTFKTKSGYSILRITIDDGSGRIDAIWFNQMYLNQILKEGTEVYLRGRLSRKTYEEKRRLELSSPLLEREGDEPLLTRRLVPIYPTTEGLSQREIQRILREALKEYLPLVEDPLPVSFIKRLNLLGLKEAIEKIHDPKAPREYERGRDRLAFDELLYLQLRLVKRRKERRRGLGLEHTRGSSFTKEYLSQLPFSLTPSQLEVWEEIEEEMESHRQMSRLLQGDVGSGKTVIAALSLLKAVEGDYQGAFMAPTEILAEQHYLDLREEFEGLGISVGLLTGGMGVKEKEEIKEGLKDKSIQVIIGTHSLFQEGVDFHELGLIIIDEQHRFGVRERGLLLEKGIRADLLVMTATPIPRSLAMTLYGDLDLSIIRGLPPNRRPITTKLFKDHNTKVQEILLKELHQGHQVYYVCPHIQKNEDLGLAAVEERVNEIARLYEPFSTSMIHGGMKREEKNQVMQDFREHRIQILVATTVIEVGVNHPQATLMVIEDAHVFGLSQLHQLRGRVGRGEKRSSCLLLGDPTTETGKKRLCAMLDCQNGFQIAEEDLKIRGPGDFLGERQHGIPMLKIADLLRDATLLRRARELALSLIERGELKKTSLTLLGLFLSGKEERPV